MMYLDPYCVKGSGGREVEITKAGQTIFVTGSQLLLPLLTNVKRKKEKKNGGLKFGAT